MSHAFALRRSTSSHALLSLVLLFAAGWLPLTGSAYLDLSTAAVERLDNGMTLIVLEEHSFPIVSVHMLYRVGARNETTGATGLAHFLEHMAFRDSENFPDTGVVSSIYAAGGEWHGYTWLDQTNYFATAARENLDLLLRIEADRMARLEIPEADMAAERNAVLTEMHGYENDPASVLLDNVLFITFLAHPYRNNTIGWESDVAQLSRSVAVDFYQRHYHPGNAVLAVAGDVRTAEVQEQVQRYFGALPGKPVTPKPHTIEPEQTGERRIRLQGEVDRQYFKIAWRAPGVSNPDYAPFLVAQELLAGGAGVSFLQNDWGTPVRAGAPLSGVAEDVTSWFPPSDQDYVFVISGSVPPGTSQAEVEARAELGILDLRVRLGAGGDAMAALLERAKQNVLRELVFDLQTTEDAAHQLAYFAGMDALEVLLALPESIAWVTTGDVARSMDRYLGSPRRNIAWYEPAGVHPGAAAESASAPDRDAWTPARETAPALIDPPAGSRIAAKVSKAGAAAQEPAGDPTLAHLGNGLPVILQRSPMSRTISFTLVTPAAVFPAGSQARQDQPIHGFSSLDFDLLPEELDGAIQRARKALDSATPAPRRRASDLADPEAMLDLYFTDILGLDGGREAERYAGSIAPVVLVLSGDFDPPQVLNWVEAAFGDLQPAKSATPAGQQAEQALDIESTLPRAVAQEELGYLVQAPAPGSPEGAAWQMALYILSHGYEGRLGKEAISNQGLIYYIDSAYLTDGRNGWITLAMGVDPEKLPAMKQLLSETLHGLLRDPPSQQEVDEARHHLLGRFASAAQSNRELVDELGRQWFWFGHSVNEAEIRQRLDAVKRQDVVDLLPAFTSGSFVAIRNPALARPEN